MNQYITAPLEYRGLRFEIDPKKAGWQIKATFPTGVIMLWWASTAMEANIWVTDITTAYAQGLKGVQP